MVSIANNNMVHRWHVDLNGIGGIPRDIMMFDVKRSLEITHTLVSDTPEIFIIFLMRKNTLLLLVHYGWSKHGYIMKIRHCLFPVFHFRTNYFYPKTTISCSTINVYQWVCNNYKTNKRYTRMIFQLVGASASKRCKNRDHALRAMIHSPRIYKPRTHGVGRPKIGANICQCLPSGATRFTPFCSRGPSVLDDRARLVDDVIFALRPRTLSSTPRPRNLDIARPSPGSLKLAAWTGQSIAYAPEHVYLGYMLDLRCANRWIEGFWFFSDADSTNFV